MKRFLLYSFGGLLLLFLLMPMGAIFGQFLLANSIDPDWDVVLSALFLTIWSSLITMGCIVLFGVPLAYWQFHWSPRWQRWGYALSDLPIVLPPSVAGLGLLLLYGKMGVMGQLLGRVGIVVPFSPLAVIFAQIFVATPFFVRAVRTSMQQVDVSFLESAEVEGADEWAILRYVLLPIIRPAFWSGFVLSWIRAMGEFGATLLFAGNLPNQTQTMPIAIYLGLESNRANGLVLASILILFAYSFIIILPVFYKGLVKNR